MVFKLVLSFDVRECCHDQHQDGWDSFLDWGLESARMRWLIIDEREGCWSDVSTL